MHSAPLSIAVVGPDNVQAALRLAALGQDVTLVVPDPDDAARLQDWLRATSSFGICQTMPTADLRLGDAALGADVSLSWSDPFKPAAVFSWSASAPVVEVLGDPIPNVLCALVEMIGGHLVPLPADTVPPSRYLWTILASEVERLLLSGASPVEIDDALEADGHPALVKLMDSVGNDLILRDRQQVFDKMRQRSDLPLLERAVAEGRWGQSTGVGWYRYPGGGGPVEDPLVEDLAAEEAHFANWPRTEPSAAEIVARLTQAKAEALYHVTETHGLDRDTLVHILHAAMGWA